MYLHQTLQEVQPLQQVIVVIKRICRTKSISL
jgi:hypothetical protein